MRKFQIESKAGVIYGVYEGDTPEQAFEAMVEEVGDTYDDAGTRLAGTAADWYIKEVSWGAEIYGRFEHLANTDAGIEAVIEYMAAIERGEDAIQADIIAANVLQRAGYHVNREGGVSIRVASIDHNEQPDARVSLVIDHDEQGYFVATSDGEDTEGRFASAAEAFASIGARWGNGWGLRLAGE